MAVHHIRLFHMKIICFAYTVDEQEDLCATTTCVLQNYRFALYICKIFFYPNDFTIKILFVLKRNNVNNTTCSNQVYPH